MLPIRRMLLSDVNNPKILWNRVEGAKSYKFSLFRQINETKDQMLWEKEFDPNDCMSIEFPCGSGNFFLASDYPSPATQYPCLKQNQIYNLVGKTNNGQYQLDTESKIMLLEEDTVKSIQELKEVITSSKQDQIQKKLNVALETILVPVLGGPPPPPWAPNPCCFYLFFY